MVNTYTPKFNLAKPAHGDVNWHIPINENWDKIDTELDNVSKISRITIDANKDWGGKNITNAGTIAATKFDCATYVLTVRGGVCYRDNSTKLVQGPGGRVAKTAPAVPANRSGEVLVRYNVRSTELGAWTDGVWGRLLKNGSPIAGSRIGHITSGAYELPVLVAPGDVIALEIGHNYSYGAENTLFEILAFMLPASNVPSLW